MDDLVTRKISLRYALRQEIPSRDLADENDAQLLASRVTRIQDAASRTNTIVTNGLLLLKLFVLHCIETQRENYIEFNCQFMLDILKVGCSRGTRGRPPAKERIPGILAGFSKSTFLECIKTLSRPSREHAKLCSQRYREGYSQQHPDALRQVRGEIYQELPCCR